MPHITFRGEKDRVGDYHYYVETDLGGQENVFARVKKGLLQFLPRGFMIKYYGDDGMSIIDEKMRQHMYIRYVQRRFPHNLHLDFLRPSFRPMLTDMIKKCFPEAEINWVDKEDGGDS